VFKLADGGRDSTDGVSVPLLLLPTLLLPTLLLLRGEGRVCRQDLSCAIHWSTYPLPRPYVCQLMPPPPPLLLALALGEGPDEGGAAAGEGHPSWKR